MNRHLIILPIAIAALAAGAASSEARAWQEQSNRTWDPGGVRALRVENARGLVTVRPSADGRIHLHALKVVRSSDADWARRVRRETQVSAVVEAGVLSIRVRYPQRQSVKVHFWDLFSDFEMPRAEVRLAIEVPGELAVHLKTASGDLETVELEGAQVLEATNGDIDVQSGARLQATTTSGDVRLVQVGAAEVVTVSGDVEALGPRGPLRAESSSGELVVRGARDSLVLETASGDIRVEGAPRGVRATSASGSVTVSEAAHHVAIETANGDVSAELAPPLRQARLTSAAGHLGVQLAPTLSCRLDIQSQHGEIELELPLDLRDVTRHRVTASVRDGSAPVVLRSTSGDITVSEVSR